MDQQTPQLNPSQLYDKRKSKDANRLKVYNKLLEQIYTRVRALSQLPNSPCYLLYTVPPFILGMPKIDLEDATVFIIYQLRHSGYEVRYTPPNMIYLSWAHHEKSYLIEQSPIMLSMIDSAEKTRMEMERKEKEAGRLFQGKKSQKKVRMATPGEFAAANARPSTNGFRPSSAAISNVLNQPVSNPTAGPAPPSASDYTPPSLFLNTISQPANQPNRPKGVQDYFQ
jgi:hypothetical protein